jgi:hypothetical protein
MTHRRFLTAAAFIGVACLTAAMIQRSGADDKAPGDVMTQLKQLQEKVAKLEARVVDLERKPSYITLPETSRGLRSLPNVPKGWQQREFNGMKYYIVPLETQR